MRARVLPNSMYTVYLTGKKKPDIIHCGGFAGSIALSHYVYYPFGEELCATRLECLERN